MSISLSAMNTRDNKPPAGFTIIEALIVLMISSVILTVALGMASRSAEQSIRLGERSLDQMNLFIEQEIFRILLGEFVLSLQEFGDAPPENYVSGDAAAFEGVVSARRPIACAGPAPWLEVSLRIEQGAGGGRLVCVAGGRSFDIARWEAGAARFEYSADGRNWRADWPVRADDAALNDFFARRSAAPEDLESPGIPVVEDVLVRFTLNRPGRPRDLVWIAPVGSTVARPDARTDFFGATRSPFDALAIDQ